VLIQIFQTTKGVRKKTEPAFDIQHSSALENRIFIWLKTTKKPARKNGDLL
jgi:hypothetical protein